MSIMKKFKLMKIDVVKFKVQFSNIKVYIQNSNSLCICYFYYIIKTYT